MKIAFIGKICSGKSTFAQYLRDNYNYDILSFGEPVKRYATEIFGLKCKDRVILQDFAQKLREIDSEVWVKYLIRKLNEIDNENIVIDDVRFPNEYNELKQNGFIFIKLVIPKDIQIIRIKNAYKDSYKSHLERLENISESYTDILKAEYTIQVNKEVIEIGSHIEDIFKIYDNK